MGKIGGSSWLTKVKRAFSSPTKEHEKSSSRRRESEHEQEEEEEKRRGKRKWIFRKPCLNQETIIHHCEANKTMSSTTNVTATNSAVIIPTNKTVAHNRADDEQRHALAVAMVKTAAAQAAVASAQAAVNVVRLTRSSILVGEHYAAAIVIQTAFRGYLARRALQALKALVKLQALVRGHNVRKRAKVTLQCMQALVRVQAQVLNQRTKRLTHEENSSNAMLSDPNSLNGLHLSNRKSLSREEISTKEDWTNGDDYSQKLKHIESRLKKAKEASSKRERSLAYAFSQQIWRTDDCEQVVSEPEPEPEPEPEEKSKLFEVWSTKRNKATESTRRSSFDQIRDPIKTVEIDTYRPYYNNSSNYSTPTSQKSPHHQYHESKNYYLSYQSPLTPSPSKPKDIQMHSASPRCIKPDRNATPVPHMRPCDHYRVAPPSYMAATASAIARTRPQSAPKQRPSSSIPEREKMSSARKRLSFPVPDESYGYGAGGAVNIHITSDSEGRSPTRKSFNGGRVIGREWRESDKTPLVHNELRRWLR